MKLIAVTFLILFADLKPSFCWLRINGPPIVVQDHRFCHPTPCCIHEANMSPCFDTPGCKLPECCGIIGDVDSTFTLTYEAKATILMSGELRVEMDGSGMEISNFGHQNDHLLLLQPINAKYILNVCNLSPCPQISGDVYTMTMPIHLPSPPEMATKVFDFVVGAYNENNEQVYCAALRARLVSNHYVQTKRRNVLEPYTDIDDWK